MDAKEVIKRMKDFGLKGVCDGSAQPACEASSGEAATSTVMLVTDSTGDQ